MKYLIISLLFLPLTLFGQTSQRDSIEIYFNLRDSIEVQYDHARTIGHEDYSMQMAKEYRDAWIFLDYRLKCWQANIPFTCEGLEFQKARQLYKLGVWALMIEMIKTPKF
jgi:hypothetical protein